MNFRKGKPKKSRKSGNMGDWEEIEYHEMKRYFYISQPSWRSALAEEMVSLRSGLMGKR